MTFLSLTVYKNPSPSIRRSRRGLARRVDDEGPLAPFLSVAGILIYNYANVNNNARNLSIFFVIEGGAALANPRRAGSFGIAVGEGLGWPS